MKTNRKNYIHYMHLRIYDFLLSLLFIGNLHLAFIRPTEPSHLKLRGCSLINLYVFNFVHRTKLNNSKALMTNHCYNIEFMGKKKMKRTVLLFILINFSTNLKRLENYFMFFFFLNILIFVYRYFEIMQHFNLIMSHTIVNSSHH